MTEEEKKKFIIRTTPKGQSVFSKTKINSGDFIIQFIGKNYNLNEITIEQRQPFDHFMQIGENELMGPSGGVDDFINHSCDPNCGFNFKKGTFCLYALKDIELEEELTWDYSTTMLNDPLEYRCLCGSKICRGKINNFKDLPKNIKEKYIKLNIIPNYIKKAYRKEKIYKLFNFFAPHLMTWVNKHKISSQI